MSIVLRALLIIASILTLIFVFRKVRNSKVRIEDSIFWFCFAVLILLFSLFPQIFYVLSDFAGTIAPVNFVFLFFIFVLLIQSFNLSMRISQADTRIKELTQQLAVEKFERYTNDRQQAESDTPIEVEPDISTKAEQSMPTQIGASSNGPIASARANKNFAETDKSDTL